MHHQSEDSFIEEEVYQTKRKRTDLSESSGVKGINDNEVWSA